MGDWTGGDSCRDIVVSSEQKEIRYLVSSSFHAINKSGNQSQLTFGLHEDKTYRRMLTENVSIQATSETIRTLLSASARLQTLTKM